MDYDMIGAIKIKDGLFIGDEFAAQVSYKRPYNEMGKYRIWSSLLLTKLLI